MLSRLQGARADLTTASDGFFVNLSWVLLLLSNPFSTLDTGGTNPRLKKIDPGYCGILSRKRQRDDEDALPSDLVIDFSQETKMARVTTAGIDSIDSIML